MITAGQKMFAIAAHLSYLLGGTGFIIAPLIILFLKKDDYFVYDHAKQALAAHVILAALGMMTVFLINIFIGILLLPIILPVGAILGLGLVFTSIMASIKAMNGQLYQYPLIQGLVNKF